MWSSTSTLSDKSGLMWETFPHTCKNVSIQGASKIKYNFSSAARPSESIDEYLTQRLTCPPSLIWITCCNDMGNELFKYLGQLFYFQGPRNEAIPTGYLEVCLHYHNGKIVWCPLLFTQKKAAAASLHHVYTTSKTHIIFPLETLHTPLIFESLAEKSVSFSGLLKVCLYIYLMPSVFCFLGHFLK